MTNGRRRRISILILALCLFAIGAVLVQIWAGLSDRRNVEYGGRFLTPQPAQVCAGDTFTYPVDITIRTGNSVSRVTEGWCREDGICPIVLQSTPYFVNFIEPYSVSITARRTVPVDMAPGRWELRHCNETHSSQLIDVQCYAVPVMVVSCD